jgi:integrase/recombinase XerD
MAQAKTLTNAEIEQVLAYIATRKYPERNRAMFFMSLWAAMRVGEIAALKMGDVVNGDGTIKGEIRLSALQTKGGNPRTVFLPKKLQDELVIYLTTRHVRYSEVPFFHTSGRLGFTANTLTQHFFWLYRNAGVAGASSHSGRRSMITSLANLGIGVRTLAAIAGHKSIAVTQKYIDVNPTMIRNAVELV